MNPDRTETASPERAGDAATPDVERSIDGIDWLRKHMRARGKIDCADALDEAFARSLKAYLELRDSEGSAEPTPHTN